MLLSDTFLNYIFVGKLDKLAGLLLRNYVIEIFSSFSLKVNYFSQKTVKIDGLKIFSDTLAQERKETAVWRQH